MSITIYPDLIPYLKRYADIAACARPLHITLHLRAGSPLGGYDRPHLDGLLAWAVVDEATQGRGLPNAAAPYALPVPLVCLWRSPDGLPLWASSCLHPAAPVGTTGNPACEDTEYLHKRAISGRWSAGDKKTGRMSLNTGSGQHMERRVPLPQTQCATWEAWAFGDGAEVTRLLERVAFVGKRRAAGGGEVECWKVEDAPDMENWVDAVMQAGRLIRPVPVGAEAALGLTVAEPPGLLGWTPPYWLPAAQGSCWGAGTEVADPR